MRKKNILAKVKSTLKVASLCLAIIVYAVDIYLGFTLTSISEVFRKIIFLGLFGIGLGLSAQGRLIEKDSSTTLVLATLNIVLAAIIVTIIANIFEYLSMSNILEVLLNSVIALSGTVVVILLCESVIEFGKSLAKLRRISYFSS